MEYNKNYKSPQLFKTLLFLFNICKAVDVQVVNLDSSHILCIQLGIKTYRPLNGLVRLSTRDVVICGRLTMPQIASSLSH